MWGNYVITPGKVEVIIVIVSTRWSPDILELSNTSTIYIYIYQHPPPLHLQIHLNKMGSDDEFTSRPSAKRVRSDQDHSKANTKDREDKKEGKDENDKKEENIDEDWLSKPPFSVGASKEGWETKWRQSCWCGKSTSGLIWVRLVMG